MTRILFIGEAVTLAHVARCATLARTLNPATHQVHTAWDPRYDDLIGPQPFTHHRIRTIPARQFAAALSRGTPIYRDRDLARYVADDLGLLDRVRPDVVVGDFRLSLDVSARLAAVPYLAVANAYWSPRARIPVPVPDITLTRLAGVAAGQRLFDLGAPAVAAWHARAFRRLRRRHGLPPGRPDIRDIYTAGDRTVFADAAELIPMSGPADRSSFIGPVPWSPSIEDPPWWSDLPTDRPVVYVTLGSSGRADLLPPILAALSDLRVTVVAATAGGPAPSRLPANARVATLLPGDRAARRAALVIGNGGSATAYQALAAGKPVIGVCHNLDQYLTMTAVERAGAGRLLRAGRLTRTNLRRAVQHALQDGAMRARAHSLGRVIAAYDHAGRFRAAVASVCP